MKLTAILLFTACVQVSARSSAQDRVSLSVKNANIKTVLDEISRQTSYIYLLNQQWAAQMKNVTIDVKDVSIEQALDTCFKDQPFTYTILNFTILIKERGRPPVANEHLPIVPEFKGRVLVDGGDPLPAANVQVQNSKVGTITDEKGFFTLKNIAADAVLEISFTGYQKALVNVSGKNSITVYLKVSTNLLDQVQIIPYGTVTKRLNTGDVSTVTSSEIEGQPVSNPLAALEGRVPGMFITQNTGVPGGNFTVQIRGQNSISQGNDPLYVIDGVPYSSELLNDVNYAAGGGNPLNFINPSDIESIDVLKDADATAIYGSRGANGVVLITTKKGKAGTAKVDINVYSGGGQIARKLSWLNTPQYLEMRREAFANDGVQPTTATAPDLLLWDTTRNTDWQKALIGGTAHYDDAQASLSGGNTATQYLIGGGFHKETTVFPGDVGDQKASVHFNIQSNALDQKLKLSLSGSYVVDNSSVVSDFTSQVPFLSPDAPPAYNADGTLNYTNVSWANPYAYSLETYRGKTKNLISSGLAIYKILPGLELKLSLGYTDMQINQVGTTPTTAFNPAYGLTSGFSTFVVNDITSWIIEPQITYANTSKWGNFNALVGSTVLQTDQNGQYLSATGFGSDALLQDMQAATSVSISSLTTTQYKYNAFFGRLNYNWRDKYLLNFTARRDGSSRFGPGKQFANFGAIGAAWIFSKENLFQDNTSFFSFGKLRASYGTSGNDQIGDYQYLDLFQSTQYPYQGIQGLYPTNLFNPDFAWEINKKIEGGVELGFLKDKVLLNASYYRNRSSNQLLGQALPAISGFTSIIANLPATVQNTGAEFVLNTVNIKTKTFTWSTSFNLTIPKNKLISYPNLSSSSNSYNYVVGQPLSIVQAYHLLGVNDTTGAYQFATSKGTPTYSPSFTTDRTALVNIDPKFFGGFLNTFRYKGVELNIMFQFVKRTGKNYLFNTLPGYYAGGGYNQPVNVLSRWRKMGDVSDIQLFTQNIGAVYSGYSSYEAHSDLAYSDASYIRLKNVSLSWQLPGKWTQKTLLQNCRVYLKGQNLLTMTHYRGLDPETQSASVLPPIRVLTAGVNLTF